eukprot:scaffold93210_cov69-Phaeocystis_antarctica.AAC.4
MGVTGGKRRPVGRRSARQSHRRRRTWRPGRSVSWAVLTCQAFWTFRSGTTAFAPRRDIAFESLAA